MIDPVRVEAFLCELTELSRRHGIHINGCGCCGSPWLEDKEMSGHYILARANYGLEWKSEG